MTLQPGQTIGRYQIIEPLGVGGMATVYKAYQPSLEREVALKVLRPGFAEDPEFFQRFQREARSIARLRHPNIVQVFDFEPLDGRYVLAMEFLEGGTLKDRVTALAAKGEKLSHAEVARIVSEVAGALSYGHEMKIVHRDVKPSNVMLSHRDRAVVTDFGIAKIVGGEGQTQTGVGIGTPEYMAPEQGTGTKVDHRADIYSLGVMAYEMLTGKVPFTADTPLAIVLAHMRDPLPLPTTIEPSIPLEAERVLMKALAKDPNDRYASATDFADALRLALVPAQATAATVYPIAVPAAASATGTAAPSPTAARGIPRNAIIGAAVALVLVLGGIGYAVTRAPAGAVAPQPSQQATQTVQCGPPPLVPCPPQGGQSGTAAPVAGSVSFAAMRGSQIYASTFAGPSSQDVRVIGGSSSATIGGGELKLTTPEAGQTVQVELPQQLQTGTQYAMDMNVAFGQASVMRFAVCLRASNAGASYCLTLLETSSGESLELRYLAQGGAQQVIGGRVTLPPRRSFALAVVVDNSKFTVFVDDRAVLQTSDTQLTTSTAPPRFEAARLGSDPDKAGTVTISKVHVYKLAGQ